MSVASPLPVFPLWRCFILIIFDGHINAIFAEALATKMSEPPRLMKIQKENQKCEPNIDQAAYVGWTPASGLDDECS